MYRAIFAILLIAQFPGCGKAPDTYAKEKSELTNEANPPAAVKETAVAGGFYPDDPKELGGMIDDFFEEADVEPLQAGDVFAIFVPHAGYAYSGACAAYAYKAASLQTPKTIVILSPSHYDYFNGVAYPDYDEFATPLGNIKVDKSGLEAIASGNDICINDNGPFAEEHGIEVQLPFIRKTWPGVKIAPFVFGNPDKETAVKFADNLLEYVKNRDGVLVVATCDLSHYHPYDEAIKLDRAFLAAFKTGNTDAIYESVENGECEIDAPGAVYAPLIAGAECGFTRTEVLDVRNSGDVSGDKSRVVGYWAAILAK